MSAQGDALRRKASEADALAADTRALIAQADELRLVFSRVRAAIDDLIGGTATGKDAQMHGAISQAESDSRRAVSAGSAASGAAASLAHEFQAKANDADRREDEARRAAQRSARR